jgi:hypothetical protein
VRRCCEYIYFCPTAREKRCYVHDEIARCCDHEELHQCVETAAALSFGDGYTCLRCDNYEIVGNPHGPATQPGFPRKQGPRRQGTWLTPPP